MCDYVLDVSIQHVVVNVGVSVSVCHVVFCHSISTVLLLTPSINDIS